MSKAKYQQYFEQMVAENQALFDKFGSIHQQYRLNPEANQDKFNDIGSEVVAIVRDWERRLCTVIGKGRYSQYSQQLSEKFWNLVRDSYDQIDMVGVKVEKEAIK